ncbi:uncharacterized protein LOC120642266 [Panicum virgatum]|uniref:Uncharacterized protein n=1 Tax=Panicum virgatum TaxID=38727 RepID=A0A8T0QFJ5_PANVG|nr:uncharacterized protein LOC120642266 [Panicum virgatum]KAG2572533.1 hypothetical protein PVAP13_7KG185300 [Panicum virgatum]
MESVRGKPSLELGVKVVRVAVLDPADQRLEGGGALFVRYYVPAGDGRRRLRVDTREVPFGGGRDGEPFWGELARFERWGDPPSVAGAAAAAPERGGIAFELRWRPRPSSSPPSGLASLLGAGARRRRPSRALARAELAWPEDAASPLERWLTLAPAAGRELGGRKAPRLLVEVSSTARAAVAGGGGGGMGATRPVGASGLCCCSAGDRCGQCGWVGSEEDMFLAATFVSQ